jgi:hypothetical protein
MRGLTPEETLEVQERTADIYRQEQRWAELYGAIVHILHILKWFPNIADDRVEKIKRYKKELYDLEILLGNKIFNNNYLLYDKILLMNIEIEELFEENAIAEEIKSKIQRFMVMGSALPGSLNEAAFVAHFENVDSAIQLWEAHLNAARCYALIYSSGFHRAPFSVVTCRIPDWLVALWENSTKQQRFKIIDGLLLIEELSERYDRWIALEERTEWLHEVRRWLLWHGRWRAAKRITRLIRRIVKRKEYYTQEGFSSPTWFLPIPETSHAPDE